MIVDSDNDSLSISLYYFLDTAWVETKNVKGKTSGILSSEYNGSLVWISKTDFPNKFVNKVKLKLTPRDNRFIGQSCESKEIAIDNQDIITKIAGDFNNDESVNFSDFSYVSEYWYRSERGVIHPDSIKELAPSSGAIPYLKIEGDSIFDHKDLAVFVQLFNWFLDSLNTKSFIEPRLVTYRVEQDNRNASFTFDANSSNVMIHCKVKNVSKLVSCRYVISFNHGELKYKSFSGKNKFLEKNRGTVFSCGQNRNSYTDIGLTRLSSENYFVSGSGELLDIVFERNNNKSSDIKISYTLINSDHEEIESGTVRINIPK